LKGFFSNRWREIREEKILWALKAVKYVVVAWVVMSYLELDTVLNSEGCRYAVKVVAETAGGGEIVP